MPPLVIKNLDALKDFVGRELGVSDWFEITQERINRFAEATEDRQWIHLDAERARLESPYSATIAHGFLTLSLASHLLRETLQFECGVGAILNYGLNRVRFPAPVLAGSRIRGRFALLSLRNVETAREAIFSVVVEFESQLKPACVAEWIMRYYP